MEISLLGFWFRFIQPGISYSKLVMPEGQIFLQSCRNLFQENSLDFSWFRRAII